ncbi:hypothetical protein FKW77_004777 [Venturia effusa]|uniref:Uncharacterized protein n=1 Tax=Venturia effusa TaxID=50376 RepID=A0A517LLD7_9PEZI|nr:hypothetical protein FKW77_004777 [Venturia effusa]
METYPLIPKSSKVAIMPSAAALTIAMFGLSCLLVGISTLITPSKIIADFLLPADALPTVYGNGLAATGMGLYYLLAAYQENRAFFVATVPMRLLTTTIFSILGGPWTLPAIWEGAGALTTLVALFFGRSQKREKLA